MLASGLLWAKEELLMYVVALADLRDETSERHAWSL